MCQSANITSSIIKPIRVIALHSLVLSGCTQLNKSEKKGSIGSFQRSEEKEKERNY